MVIIYCLAFFASLYFLTWLHEIGHAVIGSAVGYEVTSLGTGTGKPLLTWSWRGIRFFVCREVALGGMAFLVPKVDKPSRSARLLMYSGGIIAEALAALILCAVLYYDAKAAFCWIGLSAACIGLTWNIIPHRNLQRFYASSNDAAAIIDILWPRKSSNVSPQEMLLRYFPVLEFLNEIGDRRGLYLRILPLLPAYLQYSSGEFAKRLLLWLSVTEQIRDKHRFEYALLRAQIALSEADMIAMAEALDEAEELRTQEHEENYGLRLDWIRSAWLLNVERPAEALEIIDALISRHPIQENVEIGVSLLTCRLHAILDLYGLDEGIRVYDEYQRERRLHESAVLDLNVAHALAKAYAEMHDWNGAEPYYREALAFARKLGSLPQSDKELIDNAQVCFEHLGLLDDPALISTKEAFSQKDAAKRLADKLQTHQEILLRRNSKAALNCILASLLVFAMARPDGAEIDFGTLLSEFSLVAVLGIVFVFAFGFVSHKFRPIAAPMIILITILPWVAAALVVHWR